MKRSTITILALCGLLAATPASAQTGAGAPPAGRPGAARPGAPGRPALEAKRQRVRERILALRAAELTAKLGLDEQVAVRLTAALGRWDRKVASVRRGTAQARQQLRAELARPAPDPARVNRLVDDLLAAQRATWSLQEDRFKELRGLLTPAQAARLLVLLPEIDRRIQRQIHKVMRDARAGKRAGAPGRRGELKDPFGKPPAAGGDAGELVDPYAGRPRGRRGRGQAPAPAPQPLPPAPQTPQSADPDLADPF